jgi:prefoldin subunit 5
LETLETEKKMFQESIDKLDDRIEDLKMKATAISTFYYNFNDILLKKEDDKQ